MTEQEIVIEKTPEMEQIEALMAKVDVMVDPDKFAELETKYKKLLKDYTERRPAPKKQEVKKLRKAVEIANELRQISDGDITNRGYWEKSLEYRDAFMSESGNDPWTDFGREGSNKETPKTKKIAAAIKQLLDENPSDVDFRIRMHGALRDDPNVGMVLEERKKQAKKAKKQGR